MFNNLKSNTSATKETKVWEGPFLTQCSWAVGKWEGGDTHTRTNTHTHTLSLCHIHMWSISSTLNARILRTKVLLGSFFYLHVTAKKMFI